MKKLASIAFVVVLAMGSMNMQAGDGARKAWAYAKVVGGIGCMAGGILIPIGSRELCWCRCAPPCDCPKNRSRITRPEAFLLLPLGFFYHLEWHHGLEGTA